MLLWISDSNVVLVLFVMLITVKVPSSIRVGDGDRGPTGTPDHDDVRRTVAVKISRDRLDDVGIGGPICEIADDLVRDFEITGGSSQKM